MWTTAFSTAILAVICAVVWTSPKDILLCFMYLQSSSEGIMHKISTKLRGCVYNVYMCFANSLLVYCCAMKECDWIQVNLLCRSWCSWFHGKIGREDAEALLHPKRNGLYLVRESKNFPGDYALCVWWVWQVTHKSTPHSTCTSTRVVGGAVVYHHL